MDIEKQQRRQLIGIVQSSWYDSKATVQLRDIRDVLNGALVTDLLEVNLTDRQADILYDLPWGTRLKFRANVVDGEKGAIRLVNTRGFSRVAPAPIPSNAVTLLDELRKQSRKTQEELSLDDTTGLEGQYWDRATAAHEIGHALVADASGGWVEMVDVAIGEGRQGSRYSGQCRAYEVGDELAYCAAGFAAELLEEPDEPLDASMPEFEDDRADFLNELLYQKIQSALVRFPVVSGDADRFEKILTSVAAPADDEIKTAWDAAVDRATLMLLERRPSFDLAMEAVELSGYLWSEVLFRLGFARNPSSGEVVEITRQKALDADAQSEHLNMYAHVMSKAQHHTCNLNRCE